MTPGIVAAAAANQQPNGNGGRFSNTRVPPSLTTVLSQIRTPGKGRTTKVEREVNGSVVVTCVEMCGGPPETIKICLALVFGQYSS